MAANRTLSKIDALPIAHFKDNVPNFSKHLLKLAIPLKIWVSDLPKVNWCNSKSTFLPCFRKILFDYTMNSINCIAHFVKITQNLLFDHHHPLCHNLTISSLGFRFLLHCLFIAFLSDPGIPRVRSMGPSVCL